MEELTYEKETTKEQTTDTKKTDPTTYQKNIIIPT